MARIKTIRESLGWSQKRMADHLHCSQSAVARMELRQKEPGPVSVLLDQLQERLRAAVPQGGSEGERSGEAAA